MSKQQNFIFQIKKLMEFFSFIFDPTTQTASNGVVHFIDDVVYPIPSGSILHVLTKDKRFAALSDAILDSDDVSGRLNSTSKSFTIFAPTDEAFNSLPKATLEKLAEDKDAMINLLLKHVVPGTKVSQHLTHAGKD